MKQRFFNREPARTPYVQLDKQKCKACWICIENCPNQVINKVDLPWHKHALIVKPDACTGCLNCVNVCQHGAYSITNRSEQKTEKQKHRAFNDFIINNLLLISGLVVIFSGLVLQIGFHMGGTNGHPVESHGMQTPSMQYEQLREIDTNKIVCGFNHADWSTIHKSIIVLFLLLIIYHTYVHWKWYRVVIAKHLIGKNRQVMILSVLFLLVAITGLIPWFIDLSGSMSVSRIHFIEIHDKLTLVLIVFLVLHIIKRYKWFHTTYMKLKR